MKIRINEHGWLRQNGEIEVTLTGEYKKRIEGNYWYWKVEENVNGVVGNWIILTGIQHVLMIVKYEKWKLQNE